MTFLKPFQRLVDALSANGILPTWPLRIVLAAMVVMVSMDTAFGHAGVSSSVFALLYVLMQVGVVKNIEHKLTRSRPYCFLLDAGTDVILPFVLIVVIMTGLSVMLTLSFFAEGHPWQHLPSVLVSWLMVWSLCLIGCQYRPVTPRRRPLAKTLGVLT